MKTEKIKPISRRLKTLPNDLNDLKDWKSKMQTDGFN